MVYPISEAKTESEDLRFFHKETKDIVDHFSEQDNNTILPQVLYCAGCVYTSLDDLPMAIESFHKALDIIEKVGGNERTEALASYNLGHQLSLQGLDSEALPWQEKALSIHKKNKETERCIYDYEDIAWSHRNLGNKSYAISSLNKAWKLAQELGDEKTISEVACQFAAMYKDAGDIEKAKIYVTKALENPQRQSISPIYSLALEINSRLGENKLAKTYCDSVLKYGNVYAKQFAYRWLCDNSIKNGDNKLVSRYFAKYIALTDSAEAVTPIEASAKVNAMYNYALREKENALLTKENTRQRIFISTAISASSLIILILSLLYISSLRHKRELEKRLTILNEATEKINILSEGKSVHEKEEALAKIKNELLSHTTDNGKTKTTLEYEVNNIEGSIATINNIKRNSEIQLRMFAETDISKEIFTVLQTNRASEFQNWEALAETIYNVYPTYQTNIQKLMDMNNVEQKVCLLIKAGVPLKNISAFVCRSNDTVYSICRRLYAKNFDEKPSSKKWEEFIQTL